MTSSTIRSRVAAVVALFAFTPLFAWEPQTRVRMIDEAVRFMPPSLRQALEGHRAALLRGMLEPMKSEDGAAHRPPWLDGSLAASVEAEARRLRELLDEPHPFPEIARQFGTLAHYVLDAGFPPGMGDDGGAHYDHYAKFCESRRGRFPLVFYGHDHPALSVGDFRAWSLDVMRRSRENDAQLDRTYARAAEHAHPSDFDDRSVPFAVGSLSYSRSINDVVRAWLTVWERAQGDMGRTPYLDKKVADR